MFLLYFHITDSLKLKKNNNGLNLRKRYKKHAKNMISQLKIKTILQKI